jgi:hypothetical protein
MNFFNEAVAIVWQAAAEGLPLPLGSCFTPAYLWLGGKLVHVAIWNDHGDTAPALLALLAHATGWRMEDVVNGRGFPLGFLPLLSAAVHGSSRAAWSLLQAKADLDGYYHAPVEIASSHGHADTLRVLLDAKATLSARDNQ